MSGKPTIWDPLRRKDVALTPEEEVRQWFIGILSANMKVPMHMMMSEVGFNLGEKQLRADIVVYGRNARPVAVVECKRPSTEITEQVLYQAVRYNMVLNVRYIMLTNGIRTCIAVKGDSGYVFDGSVPVYEDMLK